MSGTTPPWLSVLMPVYNGAAMLEQSLNSLTAQSEGIEIILVDQASTDNSLDIARRFRDRLDLRIISAPQNENWVQNTNLALRHARADLATMLHQDDVWLPGRAALLKRLYKKWPDAAIWIHSAQYLDVKNRPIGLFAPPFGHRERQISSEEALASLLVQNTVALPATMFSTVQVLSFDGLDERLWYTADWDLWLKLASRGPVAFSPQIGAGFRLHADSQTVSGSHNLDDFKAQLAKPVERHLTALPPKSRPALKRLAQSSNSLNIWLAAGYHGQREPILSLLRLLVGLGPLGLCRLINRSRILQRVLPRLHLRRQRVDRTD